MNVCEIIHLFKDGIYRFYFLQICFTSHFMREDVLNQTVALF